MVSVCPCELTEAVMEFKYVTKLVAVDFDLMKPCCEECSLNLK
jgi:hypothetical protein